MARSVDLRDTDRFRGAPSRPAGPYTFLICAVRLSDLQLALRYPCNRQVAPDGNENRPLLLQMVPAQLECFPAGSLRITRVVYEAFFLFFQEKLQCTQTTTRWHLGVLQNARILCLWDKPANNNEVVLGAKKSAIWDVY